MKIIVVGTHIDKDVCRENSRVLRDQSVGSTWKHAAKQYHTHFVWTLLITKAVQFARGLL